MQNNKFRNYFCLAGIAVALCGTFSITEVYADEITSEVIEINDENFPDEGFR